MFFVPLTHLWGAISTACCVDPTDILGTPVQRLLSQTAAQIHTWLCPRPLLQFGGSGVCHTGCTWVTSLFACSKENNFLVGSFLCKGGPRFCRTGGWIISFFTSPCMWEGLMPGLCSAQLSFFAPFVGQMWESRCARSHFCFMWISCVLGWEMLVLMRNTAPMGGCMSGVCFQFLLLN